jgi:hypothetical protein
MIPATQVMHDHPCMVTRDTFDLVRRKHGRHASWAVWAEARTGPKSNVADLRVLDPDQNRTLLDTLRTDVVMLGLNLSRYQPPGDFANFHDPRPTGQDYKIRYAFAGTPYYGAYMTDLIKDFVMLESGDVLRSLAAHPELVAPHVRTLLEELDDVGATRPTVIAFGNDAYRLARRHIPPSHYPRLTAVTHYSYYISKEAYRRRVLARMDP